MTRETNSCNNFSCKYATFLNIFQAFLKRCSCIPHSKNSISCHYTHESSLGPHPFLFHIQDQLASCSSNIVFLFILCSVKTSWTFEFKKINSKDKFMNSYLIVSVTYAFVIILRYLFRKA